MRNKEYKLIYIEWGDAIAQVGWHSKEEMVDWAKESTMIVRQVGWLYEETKDYLVIVSRLCMDNDGVESFGNLQKIPKTWIQKRVNLLKYIK